MKAPFDCQACGACCCNTARNIAMRSRDYVEVTKGDMLYRDHKETLKTFGVRNDDGVWHLKLVGEEQRCAALDGDIGVGVGCEIYRLRPRGCRLVEAGDQECLIARKTHGLSIEVV
jgi:Fe-S-cluster containining protein